MFYCAIISWSVCDCMSVTILVYYLQVRQEPTLTFVPPTGLRCKVRLLALPASLVF
jgi:hypothetical protein